MKLGKIQKAWVDSLRKHPERKREDTLGTGTPRNYKACCLGELLCVNARLKKVKLPFKNNSIFDFCKEDEDGDTSSLLTNSYQDFGLSDNQGSFINTNLKLANRASLSEANDNEATWTEIADFIESHPEVIFTKSV